MARALLLVLGIAACSSPEVCKTSSAVGTPVVQVTAGANFTCAVLATGAARCWGYNRFGQLGLGHIEDIGDDETPASAGDVPIGGHVKSIAAGYYHACAVLETGAVRCWGLGGHGELGHGDTRSIGDGLGRLDGTRNRSIIEAGDVPLGGSAVQVVAGHTHTCALLDTGAVRCWGSNNAGVLGHGVTLPPHATPVALGDVPLGGTEYRHIIEGCDPTQADFGKIKQLTLDQSETTPTTGKYVQGHTVRNNGSTGLLFWRRLTTGTGHVVNTDWEISNPGRMGIKSNVDESVTLTGWVSSQTQRWNLPLASDKNVTLATADIYAGARFRIIRTAASTGAAVLNVGSGPLKALNPGEWCDVESLGGSWMLTGFGSL